VADYYLVELANGPAYDPSRGRREQDGWDEHAEFMDALVDDGFVFMGGPIADGNVLQIIHAPGEEEIRERLSADPWYETVLTIVSIRPWSVWLRAPS
jgi:uncharacterized protein YciI